MELAWLEDFIALAETCSFSKAAGLRHLSQPAFSRRIQALENWLGVPLVERGGKNARLTAAGKEFTIEAEEMVRRMFRIRRNAAETAARENAALHFAATHSLSYTFFPQWIGRFKNMAAPGDIYLLSDTMAGCEQALAQGKAQFLLCHYHPAAPSRFATGEYPDCRIGTDVLSPLSAPDGRGGPLWRLPGTREEPVCCLHYSTLSGLGRILATHRGLRECCFSTHSGFTSHLASVLLSMVREGRGIAWLPRTLARQALQEGRLVRAGDESWDIPMDIRLYRNGTVRNAASERFWERALSAAASVPEAV